jgi:hypothetical protein
MILKKTWLRNKLIIDLIQQNALYLSNNPPPPKWGLKMNWEDEDPWCGY